MANSRSSSNLIPLLCPLARLGWHVDDVKDHDDDDDDDQDQDDGDVSMIGLVQTDTHTTLKHSLTQIRLCFLIYFCSFGFWIENF